MRSDHGPVASPAGLIVPDWHVPPPVRALVTTRASDAIHTERWRLPSAPRWLRQVHGMGVADLDALPDDAEPVADAAFTTRRGIVCAIRTADCLPVLFAASDASAVAASHAGWRGLAAGVLEATIDALRARISGNAQLIAWLGPAIGRDHFEVGDDVRAAFMAADTAADAAFSPGRPGRFMCDLQMLARQRLAQRGITEVSGTVACTYADEARFHSHRRDVQHRGAATTGRMASLIWLETERPADE